MTLAKATTGPTSCCDGAPTSPLTRSDADELATLLKAVADPVCLRLLSIIRAAEPQEVCVCDLTSAMNLSQPTVSHHLKVLTEAGLLTRQRRGSWAWFSLVPARLADVASILSSRRLGALISTNPRRVLPRTSKLWFDESRRCMDARRLPGRAGGVSGGDVPCSRP